jgi:predicted MFS family arabinose efflux permease
MASDRTGLKQVFSWLAVGPALSNFLGPVQAGLLIDTWGFSAAFASLAILPLLSWWLVSRTPREPMAAQGSNVSTHTAVLNLLADAGFRRLLLINWLLSVCWDVHTFVVPVLGHERGLSASVIGGLLGVFAVAAVCVRVLMPWVAASLREVQVLAVAMLITVLVYGIYPLLETAASMAAASACLGLALGTVQPMIMSMLHMQVPATRLGEALALRLMFINASSVLMPVALGLAGAAVGVAALFWVTAATVVGGLPLVKALGVAEPPSDRTSPSE